jgi:hypothetical protein
VTYFGAMREAKVLEATANIMVDQDMGFIISSIFFFSFYGSDSLQIYGLLQDGDRSLKIVKLLSRNINFGNQSCAMRTPVLSTGTQD